MIEKGIFGNLKKVYSYLNNAILFNPEAERPTVKKQKEYLSSLPETKDEYELSFLKYRCVVFYYYHGINKILVNMISLFGLPLVFLYYRIRGVGKDRMMKNYVPRDLLLFKNLNQLPVADVFPEEMKGYYEIVKEYRTINYSKLFLPYDAAKIFNKAWRKHPFHFHYLLVLLIRLAFQSYLIITYRPKCITTYVCEREYADPLLTKYCENHGVRYEGHMHGDYRFQVSHAYMHFSRYWVWSEHYIKMFKSLKCLMEMQVYLPKKYAGIVSARLNEQEYEYFATYYLSDETEASVYKLKQVFDILQKYGKRCKVRPHPRFSNLSLIQKIFQEQEVEDTRSVSIEKSLDSTYLVISMCSTVISQAYYSGKKVVIDDLTDPKMFAELEQADTVFIKEANMRLSTLLNKMENKEEIEI